MKRFYVVKKSLSVIVIFLYLLLLYPSNASTNISEKIINAHSLIANEYSTHPETEYSIIKSKQLKSFNSNSTYTLYTLHPYGYMILFDRTNSLMEACYDAGIEPPISVDDNNTYYYAGPGNYYQFNNEKFVNVENNKYLLQNQINSLREIETMAQQYEINKFSLLFSIKRAVSIISNNSDIASVNSTVSYSVQPSYFSNLTNFGDNQEGTCTIIAAAMLFGYYDVYVNDKYVSSVYRSGTGTTESFHQLLNSYVYGTGSRGGIKIRDACPGFNNYLTSVSVSSRLYSIYSSPDNARNKIISMLSTGRPVIASMSTTYGADINHSVLVYGATVNASQPVSTATFRTHYGWKDQRYSYVVSAGWFYECGYLDCPSSHSYGMWKDTGPTLHQRTCNYCAYYENEAHYLFWDNNLKKCMRCKRTGTIYYPLFYDEGQIS